MIFFLLSFAQTLRYHHGWNDQHGSWPDTKREANEGIGIKQTAMTIFTHPTCTIALHDIFFSFVTRERAPKPPSTKARKGCALYYASKHRLPSCIHVWRENVRWG